MNKLLKDHADISMEKIDHMQNIKDRIDDIWDKMNDGKFEFDHRSLALTKTKLQEAMMWYSFSIIKENSDD